MRTIKRIVPWKLLITTCFIITVTDNCVFAAGWQKGTGENAGKWYYEKTDGTRRAGEWSWIDGNMDGIAECYYFDEQGWLMTSTITPDGYYVNSDGAWIENNIVQIKLKPENKKSDYESKTEAVSYYEMDYEIDYETDYETEDYMMISSDRQEELKRTISDFKNTYIDDDMSDFEKEVEIVKWLVAICEYDDYGEWDNTTAYGCIVNGKAVCSGYAEAFLQTARACGLEARHVRNSDHEWNLVKLDGDWYHVDVTWEDAGDDLDGRATFFNLRDDQIKVFAYHESWKPSNIKAKGTKYGAGVVEHYLNTGTIDLSIEKNSSDDLYQFGADVKSDTGGRTIPYTNLEDTINEVAEYISERIDDGYPNYEYVIKFKEKYDSSDHNSGLMSSELCEQIEDGVESILEDKYVDVYRTSVHVSSLDVGRDSFFYQHVKANLHYPEEIMLYYTLHLMYNGYEIHTIGGKSQKGEEVVIEFPRGYYPDDERTYIINKGKGEYTGESFVITGASPLDISIVVVKDEEVQ